jgi:hypothetical protein
LCVYASEGERCEFCVSRNLECNKVWGPKRSNNQTDVGAAGSQVRPSLWVSDLSAQESRYLAVAHAYMNDHSTRYLTWVLRNIKCGPLFGNRGALLSIVLACAAAESAFQCYESSPELSRSHSISAAGFMSCFQRRIQEEIKAGSINESHMLAFCLAAINTHRNNSNQTWTKTFERYLRGLVTVTRTVMRKKGNGWKPWPVVRNLLGFVQTLSVELHTPIFRDSEFMSNCDDTLASDLFRTSLQLEINEFPFSRQMSGHFDKLDVWWLLGALNDGTMACLQKCYSNYRKKGNLTSIIDNEIGDMISDLQGMLDRLLQLVSLNDCFNLVFCCLPFWLMCRIIMVQSTSKTRTEGTIF